MKSVALAWAIGGVVAAGCTVQPAVNDVSDGRTLVIFHNNAGPMCLAALDWLDGVKAEYAALVIEEHLTYEAGEVSLLTELQAQVVISQGMSANFEYLPIMFFENQAFSGFNDDVAEALVKLLFP